MEKNDKTNSVQQYISGFKDIFFAVLNQKRCFLSVWFLISLMGMIASETMPDKYSFTTVIGLGTNYAGQHIESVAVVRAKLNAVIIPVSQRKYYDEGGSFNINVETMVKSPSMISLESTGPLESAQDNINIHHSIFEALRKEHHGILSKEYNDKILPMNRLVQEIKELEDGNIILNNGLKRLDNLDVSVKLLPDKSEYNIGLERIILINQIGLSRLIINKFFGDNIINIGKKTAELSGFKTGLDNQTETFIAVSTTQSKSAIAPNRILIKIGSVLVGLVIGVIGALILDALIKMRG